MSEDSVHLEKQLSDMGRAARAVVTQLSRSSLLARNAALRTAATSVRARSQDILDANKLDMQAAAARNLSPSMLDRLCLNDNRIESIAKGLESVAELPDPLGRVLQETQRPNGLRIQRVSVPLGVIGIIFESRPNVTADAAALCIKSGNATILRGGSESLQSNRAIHQSLMEGLRSAGIDAAAVQLIPTTDRAAVGFLLSSMQQWLDVVVPRGGRSLIERVQKDARVPVIGHLEGLCHMYLHRAANTDMAVELVLNAKMRRTGICGALETLLVDRAASDRLLPAVCAALSEAGCHLRGDEDVIRQVEDVDAATEEDWRTEYLDAILSIRVVDDLQAAVQHIQQYGSGHTESIVSDDVAAAEEFLALVDSAIVMHNASTQFADGGEFGMGAEIGIATGRIHARGPVGAEQLTSYKYQVRGSGQARPA